MAALLTNYNYIECIVVKDSTVNVIFYDTRFMIPGLLHFADGIELNSKVILIITKKGEAIAIAVVQMMMAVDHGVVTNITHVIMENDIYLR
jgi:H/ACA ribonucleoprotein complex subunit 4